MSPLTIAIIIMCVTFIGFMALSVPISLCIVISTAVPFLYLDVPLAIVPQKMSDGLNNFALLTIPFFILAGQIMGEGGLARRLVRFALLGFGRFRGGLSLVDCIACLLFGNISGSAAADIASVGSVMIPDMAKQGYPIEYATGLTIAAAVQGVVVPPSHNLILYSIAVGGVVSISSLFVAGIIPGLVICVILMIGTYIIARKRGYVQLTHIPKEEKNRVIFDGILSIMPAFLILGGIFTGWFTASESGAVACLYAFLITIFYYKELDLKKFWKVIFKTLRIVSLVFFLMAASAAFSYLLAYLNIPEMVTNGLLAISSNKYVVFFIINVLLILLSAPMDMAPLIMIMTPILLPVTKDLGMDPIHFGIVMMLNLGIGLTIPPHGSVLFVGCGLNHLDIMKVTKAMLPLYLILIICLLVITNVPIISMFLPHLLNMK